MRGSAEAFLSLAMEQRSLQEQMGSIMLQVKYVFSNLVMDLGFS